jgi:L-threonylcarbamoyladenylate synthase
VSIAPAVTDELKENERPLSPGMKYRHYAPSAPLVLLDGTDEDVLEFLRNAQKNERCTILCYDEETDHLKKENLIPVGKKNDLKKQAETLFAALRQADIYDSEIIYAHLPTKDGLGLALYNRMIRAAAHTIKKI